MREFNITGKIIPAKHYFVDLTPQIDKLMVLADKGAYFVINRPRQFGKTTILDFFAHRMLASGSHAPVLVSFESFTQRVDISDPEFYDEVAKLIFEELNFIRDGSSEVMAPTINTRRDFSDWWREVCGRSSKKLVLLIDEIDAVPETVVIGFLAGLREMYLQRDRKPAPHSVGLVGVHDVKNLKARIRDESQALGSASPFNIAVDYELPPFSRENVQQYFSQHTEETGQEFDAAVISRVHHVTSGHPWLVSVLAKTLVETLVPDRRQKILSDHIEAAIQKLINARNPNFESLFKNARKPGIFSIVLDLLEGKRHRYNIQDDDVDLGVKYGIFAEQNQQLGLANLIYAQVLYQHFEKDLRPLDINDLVVDSRFVDASGHLDFRLVLDKFQAFMKSKGTTVAKHPNFAEATGQLLLLSYLDLLVNGKGWTFKEVQSGEGRIDVMCCYKNQKEVVELKLWYGASGYDKDLEQLVRYLESENLDRGYLVVFDRRDNVQKEYSFSEFEANSKKIQAWVI
ncbi:MAG: AAA-like domain-containing protein [bacterium]